MIILLLVLAYSMSESSANSEYLSAMERPDVDVVRQLGYIQRMSGNHSDNRENEDSRINGATLIRVSNTVSNERINTLHEYISKKTVAMCDFTCNRCYRCSLVNGADESDDSEEMLHD